jgi:hypothetical protein
VDKIPVIVVEVYGGVAEVISPLPFSYIKFDHDEDDAKPIIVNAVVDQPRVTEIANKAVYLQMEYLQRIEGK